tara:strand:+ start:17796 stop:18053 length:258 start_codon:yes stop_codon:yes gene_type:complete
MLVDRELQLEAANDNEIILGHSNNEVTINKFKNIARETIDEFKLLVKYAQTDEQRRDYWDQIVVLQKLIESDPFDVQAFLKLIRG